MTSGNTGRRTGRRPGPPATERAIVDAAREQFAARGYRAATIRRIAESAEVDPALVYHYFGSKENLLAAAMEFPEQAAPSLLTSLDTDPTDIGTELTRAYLTLWEKPETREQMRIITTMALTTPDAMTHLRATIEGVIGRIHATALPGPDPEVRFQLAMGHLLGVACVRHVAKIPPLCDLPFEDLVARVAPAIQLHLEYPQRTQP